MLPSVSTVTRLSGLARSSVVSQKSTECWAASSRLQCGTSLVRCGSLPFIAPAFGLAQHLDDDIEIELVGHEILPVDSRSFVTPSSRRSPCRDVSASKQHRRD